MNSSDAPSLHVPPLSTDEQLVVTTDTLIADVHFPAQTALDDVAHKALAVNLSDLAAMGANPVALHVQIHAAEALDEWRSLLHDALARAAEQCGVAFRIGRAGAQATGLSVLALGRVKRGMALTRHTARPGDDVWVSGTLGDAGGGLRLITQTQPAPRRDADPSSREYLEQRLNRPQARVALGRALVGVANSAVDISDGLTGDLGHILNRSGVGANIWVEALPLSEALLRYFTADDARAMALSAGDDYELCFTASSQRRGDVIDAGRTCTMSVTRIGEITSETGLWLRDRDAGLIDTPAAYQHSWRDG